MPLFYSIIVHILVLTVLNNIVESNPEHLRDQVAALMEKTQLQKERIRVLLEEEGKSTAAALGQRPASK